MAQRSDDAKVREKFVNAWNDTLIKIWQERISRLKVVDTGNLYRSLQFSAPVDQDGRFVAFSVSQNFLEYGLWQDLGVGRNTAIGNTHRSDKDGFENKREKRRWYSIKYYASTMKLKEFMAENLGHEFCAMVATLDAEKQRRNTDYYRRKGLA